jgi:hypothetical protein
MDFWAVKTLESPVLLGSTPRNTPKVVIWAS